MGLGLGWVRLGGGVAVRGWGMDEVVVVVYKSGIVMISW